MENAPLETLLTCTQCGGELHPDEGQVFVTCPYCSTTVYIDKSRVVFHWSLAPTLDEPGALGQLARWMGGNQTVKNLDKKSRISGHSFQYFPVWYFKYGQNGQEQVALQPGAATSITEMRSLKLPAGDLKRYDSSLDAQSQSPTVPLDAATAWLQAGNPNGAILETALVHIPIFTFKYDYQNRSYTALVEAGTGVVLANLYPAKAEAPYLTIGLVTAFVYLCLALLPVVAKAGWGNPGLSTGIVVMIVLGLVAAPVLMALAAWVAAKV